MHLPSEVEGTTKSQNALHGYYLSHFAKVHPFVKYIRHHYKKNAATASGNSTEGAQIRIRAEEQILKQQRQQQQLAPAPNNVDLACFEKMFK
eukprot:3249113-Amphidinium_carterae.1